MDNNLSHEKLNQVVDSANRIILGKPEAVSLSLACLLAGGHLLIEDLPGMGKTTLAHTMATLLGLNYQRIQFTSDLLPADLLGVSIYDRAAEEFHFHPGPIFSQLVLADEINRATPKTQSALLEAMEEKQITVEGETRELPKPFFVVATQNPLHQVGTFPLPESQLDRFLMRISLGYPGAEMERKLLKGEGGRNSLAHAGTSITRVELDSWQQSINAVFVAEPILDYVQALVSASRHNPKIPHGLSPRAAQALLGAGKSWAWLAGRNQVLPEDIQAVWVAVASHRITSGTSLEEAEALALELLHSIPIP